MKTLGSLLLSIFLLLPWCAAPLFGQDQPAAASEKKVVITKRKIEKDGSETVETTVKKGQAARDFDLDQYLRDNEKDGVSIDVRIEEGSGDNQTVTERRSGRSPGRRDWERDFERAFQLAERVTAERGFLGVDEDADEDPDEDGVVIQIVKGAAADKAGLRTNDILLKLDDQKINRWSDLTAFMGNTKPGQKVTVSYRRNGKEQTAEVTLGTRMEQISANVTQKHGFLGISSNDDQGSDKGVRVTVVRKSAAEKAGLRNGDVVLRLGENEVSDWEDITDFMNDTKPGDEVQIEFERGGKTQTVKAVIGEQKVWDWEKDLEDMNLNLSYRSKDACLGVYTETTGGDMEEGARINDFTEESAAKEAQLQEGDVITGINAVKIQSSDDLWDEIARFNPGDKVTVEFRRGKDKRTADISLKACRDNANQVQVYGTDEEGDNSSREFYTWNWNQDDGERLRESRTIAIHKGAEGDAAKLDNPTAEPPADRRLQLASFKATPNPTSGPVIVEFKGAALPTVVTLYDLNGRQLFREELNAFSGSYSQPFDLTEHAKSKVVVHIQQGDKFFTEQVAVQ